MGFLIISAILAVILVPVATRAFAFFTKPPGSRDWLDHVNAFHAFVTATALTFGGLWFLFERPTAPKVEITLSAFGVPIDADRVMVVSEVSIRNAGSTQLDLQGRPYDFWIQRVTPLTAQVETDLATVPGALVSAIRPADDWGAIAALDLRDQSVRTTPEKADALQTLDVHLEAGETENLYFRTMLSCDPALRVSATLHVPKPAGWSGERGKDLKWVKQAFVDLTALCKPSGGEQK